MARADTLLPPTVLATSCILNSCVRRYLNWRKVSNKFLAPGNVPQRIKLKVSKLAVMMTLIRTLRLSLNLTMRPRLIKKNTKKKK
jgi:hypothetical protein